jgi:ATP-binding cassette subfamily F protein uup
VVSHDRYLVERVCDTVFALLGDGRITDLPGGIEEYLNRRDAAVAAPQPKVPAADKPKSGAAERRTAQKELARLERQLDKLSTRESELHEALAAAATDAERLLALDAELRAVLADKSDVEQRWMDVADVAE